VKYTSSSKLIIRVILREYDISVFSYIGIYTHYRFLPIVFPETLSAPYLNSK